MEISDAVFLHVCLSLCPSVYAIFHVISAILFDRTSLNTKKYIILTIHDWSSQYTEL